MQPRHRIRPHAPLLLTAALLAAACDCESAAVPFGIDTGPAAPVIPELEPDPPAPFEPQEGLTFPNGTQTVEVEGAELTMAEGASIRALLAIDLDADGDRDALILAATETDASLMHASRDGATFGQSRSLGTLLTSDPSGAMGCSVQAAYLQTLSPAYAVATLAHTCDGEAARSVWILSMEAQPRARERVTLLGPDGRAPGQVSVSFRAVDRDQDGHEDMVLDVSVVAPGHADPAVASITWLDRPGGLARDPSEPEATFAAMVARARTALASDPAAALTLAEQALALHSVLCRLGAGPRVRFGDSDGLPCGPSRGAGAAAAILATAHARAGRVFEALEAAQDLRRPGYRVSMASQRLVDEALLAQPRTQGLRVAEGPTAESVYQPPVRLPVVGFVDEHTLLIRGRDARLYDVRRQRAQAAPGKDGSIVMRDPTGNLAAVDVHRTCDGYALRIVSAGDVVEGVVAGATIAEPLLEPQAPPPGAQCPRLPEAVREDDGGWRLVGWAPQGVVAVRRQEVRLVPLTLEGQAAGGPSALADETPPPAPLPPGIMAPDGSAYALSTRFGIVARRLAPSPSTVFFRPDPWPSEGGELPDVTISTNGRRVAYLYEGRVRLVDVPRN